MKDIQLNWYKRIIYVIGWIFSCFSLLLLGVIYLIYRTKDKDKKKVKGKLTRSFEKFVYSFGWIIFFFLILDAISLTIDYFSSENLLNAELECESICSEFSSTEYKLSGESNESFICDCYDSLEIIASYKLSLEE